MALPTVTVPTAQSTDENNNLKLTALTNPDPDSAIVQATTNTLTKDSVTNVLTLKSVLTIQAYSNRTKSQVNFQSNQPSGTVGPETALVIDHVLGMDIHTATKTYAAGTKGTFTITVTGDNTAFTPVVVANPF